MAEALNSIPVAPSRRDLPALERAVDEIRTSVTEAGPLGKSGVLRESRSGLREGLVSPITTTKRRDFFGKELGEVRRSEEGGRGKRT